MNFHNKKPDGHKIIIVLDTETSNGFTNPNVYDLGYVIYDVSDGKILKQRDYITRQVYDNPKKWETAYYADKRPIYDRNLADGKCKKIWWGTICDILARDIEDYEPDGIYAYNSRFDENSIASTCKALNREKNPTADGIQDIMKLIWVITQTEEYKEFCRRNGFMTKHKTPRCQQKAETLYRYLKNQTEFIEEHMALSDSLIELEILLESWKRADGSR